jgi:putative SOS response-associated peptidase YedK
LKDQPLALAEVLKRKKSRKKDPVTGKTQGFSSFNARFETVDQLPSFRNPWFEGRRCVIPIDAFKERPNLEDAPPEKRNVEVTVSLSEPAYLGALWDEWRGKSGESLRSFALITIDSSKSDFFRAIWHERMPVLLTENEAMQWLDPDTPLERIKTLCAPYPDDQFAIAS